MNRNRDEKGQEGMDQNPKCDISGAKRPDQQSQPNQDGQQSGEGHWSPASSQDDQRQGGQEVRPRDGQGPFVSDENTQRDASRGESGSGRAPRGGSQNDMPKAGPSDVRQPGTRRDDDGNRRKEQ